MARPLDAGFADIVALARSRLTEVLAKEDVDPDRAILSVEGRLGPYRVLIKDIVTQKSDVTRTTCSTTIAFYSALTTTLTLPRFDLSSGETTLNTFTT